MSLEPFPSLSHYSKHMEDWLNFIEGEICLKNWSFVFEAVMGLGAEKERHGWNRRHVSDSFCAFELAESRHPVNFDSVHVLHAL